MHVSSFVNVLCEAIVLFTSHMLISRIGHMGAQLLALGAYVVRFIGYATLLGPWWNLPFDALQGLTLGLQLVAMSGHVALIAAPEVQPTAQVRIGTADMASANRCNETPCFHRSNADFSEVKYI